MAKIEAAKKTEEQKWEPFATLTVSKRELAGLRTLIGSSHYHVVGEQLCSTIQDFLDDNDVKDVYIVLPESVREIHRQATEELDTLFGKY